MYSHRSRLITLTATKTTVLGLIVIISFFILSLSPAVFAADSIGSCGVPRDLAALNLTGAASGGFPSGTYTGGYYHNFPTGSDSFGFTFENDYIPAVFAIDPAWAGSGTMVYSMLDDNTTSDVWHTTGDRVTEYHDFNPGDVPNSSGLTYNVYGRGTFSFNGSSGGIAHQWQVTYDFSDLANGYLPAGTLLGFTDIDGTAVAGESVVLTSDVGVAWLSYCDDAQNGAVHGQAAYDADANSYTFDGPNSGNDSIAYVTIENLTEITMTITQGAGGSSIGLKLAAPLVDACSLTVDMAALNITGAAISDFPTGTYTGGYYQEFSTGSENYSFTFGNNYIPAGWSIEPDWAGSGTLQYTMNDSNVTSNAFQFTGDRVTEFHDFNPGDIPNVSGRVYNVYGRGQFAFNGSNGGDPHQWTNVFDFSTLANGYLPAGTLLGFTDVDGLETTGETLVLTAVLDDGSSSSWLVYHDAANNGGIHGQADYDAGANSYTFDGPNSGNDSIAYLTTQNLTQITVVATQGTAGSSIGMKLAAPLVTQCSSDIEIIHVSSTSGGNVGGVAFADEDIISYDTESGTWAMLFDGSDVGLSSSGARDVDAFYLMDDGSILLSFVAGTTIPDVGAVDDSDIVRFIPSSLGTDTAGTFEWYFDGSDVGLSTNGEDVDAVHVLADGDLLISTTGRFSVTGTSGKDEDLVRFIPVSLGHTTSGTWAIYFDGSDVELNNASSEDVSGTWVDAVTGDVYLTVRGAFSVTGASGDGADIFVCSPSSLGGTTSCTYSHYWDGSANGYGDENMDSFHIEH